MKCLMYLINYLLGVLIGINSSVLIMVTPYQSRLVAILFHYLLVKYTLIYPIEKSRIEIKENFKSLTLGIVLINVITFRIYNFSIFEILLYSSFSILFLLKCKTQNQKNKEIIEKNIKEYYEKK